MLHYKNLYKLFFESIPQEATHFFALSGFLGPEPIRKLEEFPLKSKIIYGLQKENKKYLLHQKLISLHNPDRQILYPTIAAHSKCYLWLNDTTPIKGLIGSANFSSNGLYNDYRETLLEVDKKQLYVMKGYMEIILSSCRECNTVVVEPKNKESEAEVEIEDYDKNICTMILYDPKTGQTQNGHGLNWGFADANVRPNDACIPVRTSHIKKYPNLFPSLQPDPESRKGTLKEVVEFIWDDGTIMQGRLEGSQPIKDQENKYPKQIASFPHKDELGLYIRKRLNVNPGERVLREDLTRYGRDSINISLIEEGIYFIDFSN